MGWRTELYDEMLDSRWQPVHSCKDIFILLLATHLLKLSFGSNALVLINQYNLSFYQRACNLAWATKQLGQSELEMNVMGKECMPLDHQWWSTWWGESDHLCHPCQLLHTVSHTDKRMTLSTHRWWSIGTRDRKSIPWIQFWPKNSSENNSICNWNYAYILKTGAFCNSSGSGNNHIYHGLLIKAIWRTASETVDLPFVLVNSLKYDIQSLTKSNWEAETIT